MRFRSLLAFAALLCLVPPAAHAAESYDNCAGFIDSLPATIDTQGVWCLRQNLATSIASGYAITIATNNVTIDCNDFKIGGLGAGDSSQAIGIFAYRRQNASVRHCAIRGFREGILLNGDAGHLVEDNRLDNNLWIGIRIYGENNRVRRNAVYDTGGGNPSIFGIHVAADVIDNTVAGVFSTATNTYPTGIYLDYSSSYQVSGNRVSGLTVAGTGYAIGIQSVASGGKLAGNHVSVAAATAGWGIYGGGTNTFCTDNTVVNFATAYSGCDATTGNLTLPPP